MQAALDAALESARLREAERASATTSTTPVSDVQEVEVRAGEVVNGSVFRPGVSDARFEAILMHVGEREDLWELVQKWSFSVDYTPKLPASVRPFTLRCAVAHIDPDLDDKRVQSAFPSTRNLRIQTQAIHKRKVSTVNVPEEHARISCNVEEHVTPFYTLLDTSHVRGRVRLSMRSRGWRLDLTRVWAGARRSDVDEALRTGAPPHALEVELEAEDVMSARAEDAVAIWRELGLVHAS